MTSQEQLASFILHPDEWEIRINPIKLLRDASSNEIVGTVFTARLKAPGKDYFVGEVVNSRNGLTIV